MRSIASASTALPTLPRCERPKARWLSRSGLQPGGFAHGPDEKWGLAGRICGIMRRAGAPTSTASVTQSLLPESSRRVGTAWPADGSNGGSERRKRPRKNRAPWPYAAVHNTLISLRSSAKRARILRLPQIAGRSSRYRGAKVEFLNHLRATCLLSHGNGQFSWFWHGAGELQIGETKRATQARLRGGAASERGNDTSSGGNIDIVPRPRPFHP